MEKHIANKQTEGRMDRWMGIVVSRKGMDVGKVGWIDEKSCFKRLLHSFKTPSFYQ